MKPSVLQLNPILIPAINDQLAALYDVHRFYELTDPEAWLREHADAIQAVITGGHTGISRALLERLPGLKVVAVNGVGTDAVDLARKQGERVVVASYLLTPGRFADMLRHCGADLVTAPLLDGGAPDPRLVSLVVDRFHQALGVGVPSL